MRFTITGSLAPGPDLPSRRLSAFIRCNAETCAWHAHADDSFAAEARWLVHRHECPRLR